MAHSLPRFLSDSPMPRPSPSLRPPAAVCALVLALVACSSDPTAVSVEMATDRVSRDFVDRAIGEFRKACAPMFTTHAADLSSIAVVATHETSTVIRRFGWGVHLEMAVKLRSSPTTLTGLATPERRADFLIGSGEKPGFSALSPTAARLCDLTPAPGRSQIFAAVPALAGLLPRLRYATTDAHRAWWADEMERALAGDYQSQRNIAWCYVDGCDGVEPIDDVKACAWRWVLFSAKHPKADESDAANVEADCKAALSPAEQQLARIKAAELFRRIYKSDLPKAP